MFVQLIHTLIINIVRLNSKIEYAIKHYISLHKLFSHDCECDITKKLL